MLDEAIKKQILDVIFSLIDSQKCIIFLFGSFAKHDERRTSDIDIGVLSSESLPPSKICTLRDELNEKVRTLRKIDFVDFSIANDKIFVKEAIKEAKIWYQGKECKTTLETLKKQFAN